MLSLRHFFLFISFFWVSSVASQSHFTLNGYIEDASTGEKLPGATVYIPAKKLGTNTNVYGFYSITLPADTFELVYSYVGYRSERRKLLLDKNIAINISLSLQKELKEVEIKADRAARIEETTRMGTIDIPMAQIKTIPALLGEVDVLKALQLLPGVKSGGEGSSGIYVRGGGPDQNLILLDGVPVYNASHLFGFFSVFNADAIKNVELVKGGFPARYGGRLSSVVDITMKEGNMKKFSGEGSVGIVSSKLSLEGPIIKDKTSFIVSARRTYIDILAQPFIKAEAQASGNAGTAGYYFYDLNAKVNHIFSPRDRLFLSVYTGKDKFYSDLDNGSNVYGAELGWGNLTSALRYNHVFFSQLFANFTATYSKYEFFVDESIKDIQLDQTFALQYISGIRDYSFKADFDYLPLPDHYIRFGGAGIYHTFTPGALQLSQKGNNTNNLDTTLSNQITNTYELSAYVEDDYKVSEKLKVNIGFHGSSFLVNNKRFNSLQPRLAARYKLNELYSLKASYVTMSQYLHLLSNSNIGLPTDLWLPATDKVGPETSQQISGGLARTIREDYELSVETYYKKMNGLIEYKEGADFIGQNVDWQKKVEIGKGRSYGLEVFLQKKEGKTTGWIGYTLSWSYRQFDNINQGLEFPYKYDRRHDVSIVVNHKLKPDIDLSATFVFGTGNSVTLPIDQYYTFPYFGSTTVLKADHIGDRNAFRMPAYHRLDLGINFHKKKKWGERTWSIGVYNAYNHHNPYFLLSTTEKGNKVIKQVSLFPIIPSISYGFKF